MIFRHPDCFFLVSGNADSGTSPLNAFDLALRNAGIEDVNLVRLSSILPPSCTLIEPMPLPPGALVPVAYAEIKSSVVGSEIAAAVAVAIPEDPDLPGLIMEYSAAAPIDKVADRVCEMVRAGMESRNREIKKIVSTSAGHVVETHGACFAGVVLWATRPPEVISLP